MGLLFVCLFVLSRYPLYTEPSLLTSLLCLGKPVRNDSLGSPGTPAAVIPNPTDASVSCLTAFVSHQPNCTSPLTLYFAPVSCNSSEPEFNALYSLRRYSFTPSKKKKKNLFEERKILGISGFLFLFSEQDFAFRDPKFWSGIQKFLSSENRCHEVVLIRFLRCKLTHIVILFSISVSCQPVFQLIWKLESREEHAAGPNSYSFRKDSRLTHAQLRPTPHR